jgi:hypothetical protein
MIAVQPVTDFAFGQLGRAERPVEGAKWHVLRAVDGEWRPVCTAATARPGVRVLYIADKPGSPVCGLQRCVRALAAWEAGA